MRLKRAIATLGPITVAFAIVAAVNLLPPDTSADDVLERGRLRVCMPGTMPPLVTGLAEHPGFDVEMLRTVADRMGIGLEIVTRPGMGQGYNPRSWKITRAQCDLLAGGVVLSEDTRNYLSVSPPLLATGWTLLAPLGKTITGMDNAVGFLATGAGHDRLALGQYLRDLGVQARPLRDAAQLQQALAEGSVAGAIVERFNAAELAQLTGLSSTPLEGAPGQFTYGLGFWKDDETLRRTVMVHIDALHDQGTAAEIAARYNIDAGALCLLSQASC